MNKAIFTDRDGVLTKLVTRKGKLSTAQTKDELEFFSGIREAVADAHLAGFKAFVVSNQPTKHWVPKEESQQDWLAYVGSLLTNTFLFDGYMNALDRGSRFYKPEPGMLLALAEAHDIDLTKSWMIGDRWRDAVAARLVGVNYIHIKGNDPIVVPYHQVLDFPEAVRFIIWEDGEKINRKSFIE